MGQLCQLCGNTYISLQSHLQTHKNNGYKCFIVWEHDIDNECKIKEILSEVM